MINLLKKTWFQMAVGGVIIGVILIALDLKSHSLTRNKKAGKI